MRPTDLISLTAALTAVSLSIWGFDYIMRSFEEWAAGLEDEEFVAELESEGTKPVTGNGEGEWSPNAVTGFVTNGQGAPQQCPLDGAL